MDEAQIAVKVGGDYAIFSRPEFKVERVTYDMMTPSAARGVLEAIFWKPEVQWEIREIAVLNEPRTTAILRNEIDRRQGTNPFLVDDARQQRMSLLLVDVAYVIKASLRLREHATDPIAKYLDQARRRIERGQFHHAPYLGAREFAAWFEPPDGAEDPIHADRDLGTMFFDWVIRRSTSPSELSFRYHDSDGPHSSQGSAQAMFFHASLRRGVLVVPSDLYADKARKEKADVA